MGRAEQRRAQKEAQKEKKTYNMSPSQIDSMLREAAQKASDESADKAISYAVHMYSVILAETAILHLGFGPKRLSRLLSEVSQRWESISNGDITIEFIEQYVHFKTGIDLSKDGKWTCSKE